jgi:predicted extracellular nuclease
MRRIGFRVGVALACTAAALTVIGGASALAPNGPSSSIVISQVYGGGGNSGATYTNDFVELFNRGASAVSVDGWSVQYASSTGSSWSLTTLSGTILPGRYYLVQEAKGAGGTTPLPTPDATGSLALSGTNGKVALSSSADPLSGTCPTVGSVVDFVGFGSANCSEGSATPALSNTTAAIRAGGGCVETDSNATDFAVEAPAPRNSASPAAACGTGATSPSGIAAADPSSVPAGGSTLLTVAVQPGANPASTGIAVTADLTSIGGSATQALADDGSNGDATAGDGTYSYRATVDAGTQPGSKTLPIAITDAQARSASTSIALGVSAPCGTAYTHVYDIQGAGAASPLAGQRVTTEGVVVGDDEGPSPALRGFYIQDPTGDGNAATSDGVFVFDGSSDNVHLGDRVRVSGTASEFQDQTQISASTISTCATGLTVPATDVFLPVPPAVNGVDYLERFEGMLVRMPQTLTVTEHFQLGRFGQVLMSSGGRLEVPTNVVSPGAPAVAMEAANRLNQIIFDDPTNDQNPDPILFGRFGNPLSAVNTLRGGDTATGVVGVMTYTWAGNAASGNAFRVRPVEALGGGVPDFQPANPRPTDPPAVGGNVKVGAMNLLNFFNTFGATACSGGVGGEVMECRGADNAAEFARQWPKTVAAINGLGADVVGIMEMENDGYGPESAIAFLVDRLNEATAPGTWAYIDVDAATGQLNALGNDAIKVGMLYKPTRVTPVGRTAVLNSVEFVNGGDSAPRNRPSLAQAFRLANGEEFVVDANHLKSKGSACDAPDTGDGQANCAGVRTNAARLLASWLASDPTGVRDPDVILVGDLNSYAKEDPIVALEQGGFTNLIESRIGAEAYSYAFDGEWGYLDHALGTQTLASQVSGIGEWHINADEPSVLDYNTDFKSAGQIASLYAADRYRMSDHDPLLVGLNLKTTAAGVCSLTQQYVSKNAGLQNSLCVKLGQGSYGAFANEVRAQSGKALTPLQAEILVNLAGLLA